MKANSLYFLNKVLFHFFPEKLFKLKLSRSPITIYDYHIRSTSSVSIVLEREPVALLLGLQSAVSNTYLSIP